MSSSQVPPTFSAMVQVHQDDERLSAPQSVPVQGLGFRDPINVSRSQDFRRCWGGCRPPFSSGAGTWPVWSTLAP